MHKDGRQCGRFSAQAATTGRVFSSSLVYSAIAFGRLLYSAGCLDELGYCFADDVLGLRHWSRTNRGELCQAIGKGARSFGFKGLG